MDVDARGRSGPRQPDAHPAPDLHRPDPRTGPQLETGAVPRRLARRRLAQVPRLPHRRPHPQGPKRLRRQLDLHPRPERESRPHPELQVMVAGDGARPVAVLLRPGVFLLRGRRHLGRR